MSNFLRFVGGAAKEVTKRKDEQRKSKLALKARLDELTLENMLETQNAGFNIGGTVDPDTGIRTGGITLAEDARGMPNDDTRFTTAIEFFSQLNNKDKQNPGYMANFLAQEKNKNIYDTYKTILNNGFIAYSEVGKDDFKQMDVTPYKDILPSDVYQSILKFRNEEEDVTSISPMDDAISRLTGGLPNNAIVNQPVETGGGEVVAGTAPATENQKEASISNSPINKDYLSSSIAYTNSKRTGNKLNNPKDPLYILGNSTIDLVNNGQATVGITHYASTLPKYKPAENVGGFKVSKVRIQDEDEFSKQVEFHSSRYTANRNIYETIDSISKDIIGYVQPNADTGDLEYVPGLDLGGSGLEWKKIMDNYFEKDGGLFDQIATLTGSTVAQGWLYSGEKNRQRGTNNRSGVVDEKQQIAKYGMTVNSALAELQEVGKASSVTAKLIGLAFQIAIADQDYQGGKSVSDADFQRAWRKITGGGSEEGSLLSGFVNPKVLITTLETVRDSISRNAFESWIISQDVVGPDNKGFTEIRTAIDLSEVIAKTAKFTFQNAATLYNKAIYGENKSDPRRSVFSDRVSRGIIEKYWEDKEFTGTGSLTDVIGQAGSMFNVDAVKELVPGVSGVIGDNK